MDESKHKKYFDGIVCFAGQDWWYHNRAHSDVQIAQHLSNRLPVLLINSLGMRTPRPGVSSHPWRRIFRKMGSIAKGLRKVSPSMWVFSPVMLPPTRHRILRILSAHLIAIQIRLILKILGIRQWFSIVTVPTAVDVLEFMPEVVTVFNRSDAFSKFEEASEIFIKSCEKRLFCSSDLILYVNKRLMNEDEGLVSKKYYFGHGVDFDLFSKVSEEEGVHPEIKKYKRPIVGFFGSIDDSVVDLKLIEYTAKALPKVSFVLIGLSTTDISFLTDLPNVVHLGPKLYSEIPRYGAGFDVGIMPWLQNEWIEYCNPIKLKEYLALGLPVVTTPIPQSSEYGSLIYVAHSPEEFVQSILSALNEKCSMITNLRKEAVRSDSWQSKADELLTCVFEIKEKRNASEI